jgi:iron complex outermembrane receptor protein
MTIATLARFSILTALCAWGLSAPILAAPNLADTKQFDIPADTPLSEALIQWANLTGMQVMFASAAVGDQTSPPVRGSFTARNALASILQNSGLSYSTEGRTVTIVPFTLQHTHDDASDDATNITDENPGGKSKVYLDATGNDSTVYAAANPSSDDLQKRGSELEEVVVTGTHIAGSAPTGSALKVYSRDDIAQSGAATLDQFARQMVESFSGADLIANSSTFGSRGTFGQGTNSNLFQGASFNLHGLGPSSTLTLLDGHRLAGAGFDASLIDISMIPVSAIDHIEVLSDGASAIYGSDAVAGVVNIITRKDFDGALTTARYGAATSGGSNETNASQLLGKSWKDGNALVNYEYDDQGGLDASQRNYIGSQGGPYSLIPENRRNSFFLAANQRVGDGTTISANALYSKRSFDSALTTNVPFVVDHSSNSGYSEQSGATIGIDQLVASDWHANLSGNYSRMRQHNENPDAFSYPAFGFVGTDESANTVTTSLAEVTGLVTGSLFTLPAGSVKSAAGGTFRTERFSPTTSNSSDGVPVTTISDSFQRHVTSAFGEVLIPLIGTAQNVGWARRLELSLAGRYDHYSDFGSTANPKYGLLWEPVRGVDIRGTYGTSFQAPTLNQLGTPISSFTQPLPDPSSPSGITDTLETAGGNPLLSPEISKSFSSGIDVKPQGLPHLTASLSYFHVSFKNEIQFPPYKTSLFGDPILASFITRNPPLALVQRYFDSPGFAEDIANGGPAGVEALYIGQYANIASTVQSGIDLSTQYSLPTSCGQFNFSVSGIRLLTDKLKATASATSEGIANTFAEPTKWKGTGVVGWTLSGFTSAVTVNFVNSYENNLFTPSQRIGSWTTANVFASYRSPNPRAWYLLRDLTTTLSVANIANTKPPYVQIPAELLNTGQNPIPFDAANASPVGRLISLSLSKKW